MTVVTFVGAKGGVGTTTLAALTAIGLARTQRVELVGHDTDVQAVLGVPITTEVVHGSLAVSASVHLPHPWNAVTVVDAGTTWPDDTGHLICLVVRNDYVSLTRANRMRRPDLLILVLEHGRSLTVDDVTDLLGMTPIVIPADDNIGHAVDAGVLAMRAPRVAGLLADLVAKHGGAPRAKVSIER